MPEADGDLNPVERRPPPSVAPDEVGEFWGTGGAEPMTALNYFLTAITLVAFFYVVWLLSNVLVVAPDDGGNTTITIKDKAIGSHGAHLVLDSNGLRWRVKDPFLYNDLMIGKTYEILYKGIVDDTLEGQILDATPIGYL